MKKIFILCILLFLTIVLLLLSYKFSLKTSPLIPSQITPSPAPIITPKSERKNSEKKTCTQVITPANNIQTGECKEFATPCDVPSGWRPVPSCN